MSPLRDDETDVLLVRSGTFDEYKLLLLFRILDAEIIEEFAGFYLLVDRDSMIGSEFHMILNNASGKTFCLDFERPLHIAVRLVRGEGSEDRVDPVALVCFPVFLKSGALEEGFGIVVARGSEDFLIGYVFLEDGEVPEPISLLDKTLLKGIHETEKELFRRLEGMGGIELLVGDNLRFD